MKPETVLARLNKILTNIEQQSDMEETAEDLRYLIYKTKKRFRLLPDNEQWKADQMDRLAALCFSASGVILQSLPSPDSSKDHQRPE